MPRTIAAAFAALSLFVGTACSDESTGPASVVPALALTADTARSGAVLAIDVAGVAVTDDTLTGWFGDSTVSLARASDASLAVLVPALAAGPHTLAVAFGEDTLRTTVTVLPALSIADPVASITTRLHGIRAVLDAPAPAGADSIEWALMRARVDSLANEAAAALATLTSDQQLQLARLMVSLVPEPDAALYASVPAFSPAHLFLYDTPCGDRIGRTVTTLGASWLSWATLQTFVKAPPLVHPLVKHTGALLSATAFLGSMALSVVHFKDVLEFCLVNRKVGWEQNPIGLGSMLRAAPSMAAAVTAPVAAHATATPQRFFTGRAVTGYAVGEFRAPSSADLAPNSALSSLDAAYARLYNGVQRFQSALPDAISRRLPTLPAPLAQRASGAFRWLDLAPGDVTIENVKPANVNLVAAVVGSELRLTANRNFTDDVPFTFDVVSVRDAKIRATVSGVGRAMMSASWVNPPTRVVGTRTTREENGTTYRKLACGGGANVRIKGGDTGRWSTFASTITGPGLWADTTALAPAQFTAGDYPFTGSWYWESAEDFMPFTVSVVVSYVDELTGLTKPVPALVFTCE